MDLLLGYLMDAARWVIILILAAVYPESYSAWHGRVMEIVRADEFKVARSGDILGELVNVRLYGVDAPLEVRKQPFGKEAKAYADRRLLGRVVKVQPLPGLVKGSWYRPEKLVPRDDLHWQGGAETRYHRVIALVHLEGVNINEEYLSNGIAWWYEPFVPFERGYKHLQDAAQKAGKGLWALPDPVPPWKWQKTPLAEVNPWQRKKWALVALAGAGVFIAVLFGLLLVQLAKRFLRLLRPRARRQHGSGSHA
ncbi:MAG: thermonuclease family protein [Desulfomonilaceae bacterium]|nr:thermonuclease family protein [Desulfomonilaceae bacterium]